MTQSFVWSNGMGSRGRMPWLLLIKGDEVIPFAEENIPGVVVIRGKDYEKNGKWSHTTYRLEVADGVRIISGRAGWETGLFAEGLGAAVQKPTPDTWTDVAEALGVSVPSAMEFLRGWRPKAAEKLDEVDQALVELEEVSDEESDSEIVTVSFGSPSNRAAREGYWELPKGIPGYSAEIRLIDPVRSWTEGNISVVGISGKILSVKYAPGYHGGYYAVSVAIVPGTESPIPPFETSRQKAARESGLPEQLFFAFDGDVERVKAFMANVDQLDFSQLDDHEMSCGRARKEAEIIRVSGDQNFFLGADPLEVCWYIFEAQASSVTSIPPDNDPLDTAMAEAIRKAGLL